MSNNKWNHNTTLCFTYIFFDVCHANKSNKEQNEEQKKEIAQV